MAATPALLDDQNLAEALGEGYTIVHTYGRPGKQVYVARNALGEMRVVKQARRHVGAMADGVDHAALLRQEFAVLQHLSGQSVAPEPLALVEGRRSVFLVQADLVGDACDKFPTAVLRQHLDKILAVVARLHRAGFVHLDLKLANFVFSAQDERVHLIDFESAQATGSRLKVVRATRGYQAPELQKEAAVACSMDVFALGGIFFHAALGVCPSTLSIPSDKFAAVLRLNGYQALATIVAACVVPKAEARPSIDALIRWTAQEGFSVEEVDAGLISEPVNPNQLVEVFDSLQVYTVTTSSGATAWRNNHIEKRVLQQGINLGAGGMVLGLAHIYRASESHKVLASLLATADWLSEQLPYEQAHGLFTGNAGVALALATAQPYTCDGRRYQVAIEARLRAAAQVVDADLFSGKAGVVYAGLLVDRLTGQSFGSQVAEALAADLKRVVNYDGVLGWANHHQHQPDELPSLGASHGSAGIAMALYAWGTAHADEHARDLAVLTFKQLLSLGRCAYGTHLRHDVHPESRATPNGHWCHGVAGVLWAILMSCGDDPKLRDEIDWAAERFFAEPVVGNTTICHGLSGQLELALMLRQLPRFSARATRRSHLLREYIRHAQSVGPERRLWPSENPTIITPDLWVGALGPATALALSQRENYSPLLSLEALARA